MGEYFPFCTVVLILLSQARNVLLAPTFTNMPATANVNENLPSGTSVFQVTATPGTTTFAISPASAQFSIAVDGTVTTTAILDYESAQTYLLTIEATDGTTISETLTVNVNDLNDNPPTITGNVPIALDEEVALGTVLTLPYTVDDADSMDTAATLVYTISGGSSSFFNIDSGASGQITVAKRLDYEFQAIYTFDLVVTDAAMNAVTAAVTVNLNDINDNTPSCTPGVYYPTIAEGTAAGTNVQTLACSDVDGTTANNALTYSIVSGDDATPKFTVSGSSIQTSANAIDYETLGGQAYQYTLIVNVVDSGASPLTATATVVVQVTPVNEASPVFNPTSTPYTILENVAIGTVIDTIVATDTDSGADGTVSYQITSTTDSGGSTVSNIFGIDASTGQLTTITTLDRDAGISHYDVVIRASDSNASPRSTDTTLRINIGDYNDNAPKFSQSSYSASIPETSAVGTSIVLVAATDNDQSSTLSYAIETGDTTKFEFDTTVTGQFQLKSLIDLDQPTNDGNYYTLRVIVKDGGTPELTGTASVTVSITSVNQHDPVFGATVPSNSVTFAENSPAGTSIATVAATDNDYGTDGDIKYSITGGDAGNYFTIDTISGTIISNKPLDFEDQPVTNLEITATDSGLPSRSASTTVTVTVTDVNDNVPSCTAYSILVTIPESSTVNTAVTSLTCTDNDATDTLTYSISNGDPSSNFAISGVGAITLSKVVDYDSATQTYNLEITVTDGTNPVKVNVIVNVGAVNEATPTFPSNPTFTYAENISPGFVITTYGATDSDFSPHAVTQYQITTVSQSGASLFSIDSSSGELRLLGNLDYELLPAGTKFYLVTVEAVDGGSLTGTGTVTVSVTDVNDNSPVCTQSSWTVNVDENTAAASNVQTLACSDADGSAANNVLTYSIVSGDDTTPKFTVSGSSIQTSANAIDYETLGGQAYQYTLIVNVVDSGASPLTATATIVVQVTPVNEASPVFNPTSTPYTILENVAIGTVIDTIVATDTDSGADGTINYQIASITDSSASTVSNIFGIDTTSGQLSTLTTLDRDAGISHYDVVIRASDSNPTPRSTDTTLRINIGDYNDNAPKFSQSSYSASIPETSIVGTSIVLVAATDNDQSSTLSYAIETGDTTKFEFDTTVTGQFQLKSLIDLDKPTNDGNYYTLRVIVKDGGTPELTGTASVTVSITSVNQHDPVFGATVPSNSVTFPENTAAGTSIATVAASDNDYGADGVVKFSITGGDLGNYFTIDAVLGTVTNNKQLDFENQPVTNLEVTAADSGSTSRSATITVTITVTNVNDNTPSCTSYSELVNLPETASVGDAVITLICSDSDASDTLTYSISNGDPSSNFAISTVGAVTLNKVVDYDSATQTYNLEITVTDGTNPVKVNVIVNVGAVNEATPTFPSNPTFTYAENISPGFVITTYGATDSDFSPHAVTQYQITTVTNSGAPLFSIDPSDGKLQLSGNLDYEALPTAIKFYLITVEAIDGGGLTGTGTVTVSVTDVNDNSPVCTQSSWTVNINENQATPFTVISPNLGCTDAEDGTTLTYSLVQTPGTAFTISAGVLSLTSALDFETASSHALTITVTDTAAMSTTLVVNVNVVDVNEGGPTFPASFTATIPEDAAAGTSVQDVVATDPDTNSDFGVLEYSIISGDASNQFSIDASSGRVTTRSALDRELISSYNLVIHVKEKSGTNTATTNLAITVSDINDNSPSCTTTNFAVTVTEDKTVGFVVLSLLCTDPDTTGAVTYAISAGDTATFEMSGANLQLKQTLDFDAGLRKYDLVIAVSDGTNNVIVSGSINVGPVNEASPVFVGAPYTVTFSEATPISTILQTVSATDADSADTSDGTITYSFTAASTQFSIGSSSGAVILLSTLDRESAASHVLNIQASDGTNTVLSTLTVNVDDENDNTPVFSSTSYSGSISESDPLSTTIVTVAASDADSGLNGQISFSISGGSTDFAVGATNGIITNLKTIDYETATMHVLTIIAVDRNGDATSKSSSALVTITVGNVNEHDPVFTQTTYTFNLAENAPVSTSTGQVVASDADSGDDGSVYYTLPTANTFFYLDQTTGEIRTKSAVDFETQATHSFEVVAFDRGTAPQKSATATVSVVLTNVNDASPICTPSLTVSSNREDSSGTIATLACTDADSPTLSYSIESVNSVAGSGIFNVGGTGIVSLTGTFDYETTKSYSILIVVSDGGTPLLTASTTVNLMITDVNETPPVFTATPFTATVSEAVVTGKSVLTVAASDSDTGETLIYSLSSTTYLVIDANSGLITLSNPISAALSPYTINVCATDSNTVDAVRQTCETLTVTITDTNNNSPIFNPAAYTASVDENAINAFSILTVTATDADSGAFGTITFTITAGNTNNVFGISAQVDPTKADITVNDQTFLDYESLKSYSLTVTATDGGGKVTTAPVTISVNPINESPPVFAPASSTQSVPEDAVLGLVVVTVVATDGDDGADGTMTYSIASGASGNFGINSNTGAVTVTGTLDRETTQSYTIVINAVDSGTNPSQLSGTYTLTVDVTDVNDNPPTCTQSVYTASLAEDTAAGSSVAQLVCSDSDQDPASLNNALVFVEIPASDPSNLFEVNAAGLVTVSTGAVFDREALDNYQYSVRVSDQGGSPKSVTTGVYISITDINDNTPTFTSATYSASPPENQGIGSTLVTVTATDPDLGSFGEIEYTITSGNAEDKFVLDSTQGSLVLKNTLDRETTASYTLGIQAADKGAPARVAVASITVTVTDVNDESPICDPLSYSGSVPENAGTGTSIVTVTCPDNKDLAPNNIVAYSITNGDPSNHFTIISASGEIQTNAALDAQTTSLYSLTVSATDGVLSTTAFVQITVTDINQQAPQFTPPGPYTVPLAENVALGTTVIDLDATDADPTAGPFVFSITGGNGDNKFKIDPSNGVIIVQNSLDADTTASYSLNIEVADGTGAGSMTSTSAVTVTVTGVNDISPVCNPPSTFHSIPEGSTAGTVVTTLACTDADIPAQTLVYSFVTGNGGGEFALDSASGQISLTAVAFDYETKTDYSLEIQVSDQGTPALSATATVKVVITPVNEHAPVFTAAPYTATQPEDAALSTTITTVAATDSDQGLQHGTIRYSIVSGDAGGLFTIGMTTGEIQLAKQLDFETLQTHTLTIRATDDVAGSGNEKSAQTTLTISVTDKNDNSPVFNPEIYSVSVVESAAIGATILTVTSTDDDSGVNKNAVYSIVTGDANNDFSFVGDKLTLAKQLDFETVTSYNLGIQVVDQGVPALTDTAVITVTVQSVNEFPPVLSDTNPTATISESTPAGTILYKATATDNDAGSHGQIKYYIVSGNGPPNPAFLIDEASGDLMVLSQLDFDTPPQVYTLGVEARDSGGMTDTLSLTVTLTDVNDHTPLFTQNTYNGAVNEGATTGTSVTTVLANDADSGVNGQVTYSIVSGDGQTSFSVHPTTGVIITQAALDYEVKTLYYLVVQAVDGGATALTSSCLVKISINDINDNAPVFSPADFTVNIGEDATTGTSVTTVNAKDTDSTANGNNIFTYSLTDAFFAVNGATGEVTVKSVLDRETTPSHVLTVLAIDQGTPALTGTVTLTVNLDDINDNAPVITGTYNTNVPEDKAVGTVLFTVAATDSDAGDNGELVFSITNGNTNSDFKIDAGVGAVQINKPLDRETTPTYTLEITVSDKGAVPKSDLISVVVTVDDINDNDPVFTGTPYAFSIAENVPKPTSVNTVAATDADAGTNGALVFDFVNFWQGDPTHFVIDAATGVISTAGDLDRETTDTYVIRCRVQDKGVPIRSALINITVTITDLNDNSPVFASTNHAATTVEESNVGTSVLQVTVTDADIGVNDDVTLSIDTTSAPGVLADTFLTIDSATGVLSVKSKIDRETNPNFAFQILAVDGGTPALTSTATVTLVVLDINDNSPVFNPSFYNSEVAFSGQCSRVITTVTATDADENINAQLGFFLAQQSTLFEIDGTSGTLSLKSSQSTSPNTKYIVSVGAKDNGSPSNTATSPAQIRIDTFIPNSVAVTFQLSISKADFEARRAQFITELKALLVSKYPTCRVVVWCLEEREGTSVTPPARRRLLASSPVNVHTYVVADDTTDNQANLNQGKTFLTYDQILAETTSDAAGSPSTSITGTSTWNPFAVEKVTAYTEETTPWQETPEGIAIIVICCILLLLLICLLFWLCFRRYRKKKRPVTPVRPVSVEKRREEDLEKIAPVFVTKKNNVPDLNLFDAKKQTLPAVLALPMPSNDVKVKTKAYREPVWGAPDDTKIPVPLRTPKGSRASKRSPKVSPSTNRQPTRTSRGGGGANPDEEANPRNIIIEPREDDGSNYRLVNREFDGRAVDPLTGRIYEYNTKTNERRWVSTPDGHDIKVDLE